MRIIKYILLLILFTNGMLYAQQNTYKQVVEDVVEQLAASNLADFDYSEVVEYLEYYYENPININEASFEDLEKLWVLNSFQIQSLLSYQRKYGELKTIYELQLIDGFDYTTIRQTLPFIRVSAVEKKSNFTISKAIKYGKNTLFFRTMSVLETPVGYEQVSDSIKNSDSNKYYLGSKASVYSRYQFQYKKQLYFGFTTEKDAGETVAFGNNQYGFDFYSLHFQLKDMGWIKNVVVGDYTAQMGQGLVVWSAMRSAKSTYVMNIRKNGVGLKKYSSTNENLFMRGAGVTLGSKALDFTLFASHKAIDANLKTDSTINENSYFTTITDPGIHALEGDLIEKDAVKESIVGGNVAYRHKMFKVGVTGLAYQFSHPIQPSNSPHNYFSFEGTGNFNVGADAQLVFRGLHLFGEVGMSQNKSTALLIGSLMNLSDRLKVSVLFRDYKKDYHALYAGGFAENSYVQNEQGIYMGIEMSPIKKWRISAYYDHYKFPWLKSTASAPSQGNDFIVQADFITSRQVNMYWRAKFKSKQQNANLLHDSVFISPLVDVNGTYLRYQINYTVSDQWDFRNRLELSRYKKQGEAMQYGYLLYQDVICSPFRFPLSFTFRYAVFDTESFNSRIYAYESDLLYVYSILPYYNTGTRTYLMLKYNVNNRLVFWLRYSQTWYTNVDEVGSGLNTIPGNVRSDIKFQLRFKF